MVDYYDPNNIKAIIGSAPADEPEPETGIAYYDDEDVVEETTPLRNIPGLPNFGAIARREQRQIEFLMGQLTEKLNTNPIFFKHTLELTDEEYKQAKRMKKLLEPLDKCTSIEAAIKKVQHILNKINETSTERSDSAGDYGTQASDTEDGGTGKQDSTESET